MLLTNTLGEPWVAGSPHDVESPTLTVLASLVKTFGDPDFALNVTSNSTNPVLISIRDSSIATISSNIVTIVGAGDTVIVVKTREVPGKFNAGLQTVKLKVRKADPVLTITDQNKFENDPDFIITTS